MGLPLREAFHRGTAALGVQSVVFLAVVRDEGVSLEHDAAGGSSAASGGAEEKVEADQYIAEEEKQDIAAPSTSPVVMVQAHTRCERMTSPASTGSSGPH